MIFDNEYICDGWINSILKRENCKCAKHKENRCGVNKCYGNCTET